MEIFGYFLALVIGMLVSILGGGGSILTVPVLVYIFMMPASVATGYSLLIVGVISAVASLSYLKNGLSSPKTALFFSFPSFIMVYLTRKFVLPLIPEQIFQIGSYSVEKGHLIMVLFAILMLVASKSMITGRKTVNDIESITSKMKYGFIFMEGLTVGLLTGLVGVGGGFLIIPVLTNFIKLPMKLAVGTSLMIIAINSLIGFLGDLSHFKPDFKFLLLFIGLSLIGAFIGLKIQKKIKNEQLKPAFGWFTLIVSMIILFKEVWH
jgi:uncharacterized protein